MSDIKLSAAAWSFVGTSLQESAAIWRSLGIDAMDLIALPGGELDSQEITRNPESQASRVGHLGMDLASVLYFFGEWFDDNPVNSVDESIRARNLETFKRVLVFCNKARIPCVCVLPGVDQAGISHEEALRLSGEAMSAMASLANLAIFAT